jgi:hypothetical protein
MKKFVEKLFGIDKIKAQVEASLVEAEAAKKVAEEAITAAERATEAETLAKLSAKDKATRLKEPWVGVIETHVNKDNVRNGFFELDWNDLFVLKLKQEGYGFDGDKEEEIIDRWFRELCAGVVVDGDFGGAVNTGVIDINTVKKNNK